jgi:transcriptional regulator with XRE-family HTH domain
MRRQIDLARLAAAYQASEFRSEKELADAAGVAHTTISRWKMESRRPQQGKRSVVRATPRTIERLARALRVTEQWLTGEEAKPIGLTDDAKKSTKQAPHISKIMDQIVSAARRDLSDSLSPDQAADCAGDIASALFELALPAQWQRALLVVKPGHHLHRADPATNMDRGLEALEYILTPWFEGRAYLDPNAALFIATLFRATRANPPQPAPLPVDPSGEVETGRAQQLLDRNEVSALHTYAAAVKAKTARPQQPGP